MADSRAVIETHINGGAPGWCLIEQPPIKRNFQPEVEKGINEINFLIIRQRKKIK